MHYNHIYLPAWKMLSPHCVNRFQSCELLNMNATSIGWRLWLIGVWVSLVSTHDCSWCGAIVNPSSTVWLQSLHLFKSCDHLVKDVSLWWLRSVSYESSCEDTHYFHIEEVATSLSLKAATSIAWRAIVEDWTREVVSHCVKTSVNTSVGGVVEAACVKTGIC